ncbi:hypothetical protein ACQPYH_41770 [Kribbella sp. CA-245084]|uniref:hypothetical protein n=1 Tax=Kribbella sp. CA-245084 TaxID=3239940 RepID=UPI003D8DECF3
MGTLAEAMMRSGANSVVARVNEQAASILAKTQMSSRFFEGLAATPQTSRIVAQMNEQAASILAKTQTSSHLSASILAEMQTNSRVFEGLAATAQTSRIVAQMNEQAASILAKTQMSYRLSASILAKTQTNSRVFEGLAATPEWARISARINQAAANTLVELGTRPDSALRDAVVASPELEQVVELATTVATDAARPKPLIDSSVPPLVITATIFVAVYALLLTLYFDAFEGTSDYLLAGNIVERLDMMNSLAELAGAIAFACTPRRKR